MELCYSLHFLFGVSQPVIRRVVNFACACNYISQNERKRWWCLLWRAGVHRIDLLRHNSRFKREVNVAGVSYPVTNRVSPLHAQAVSKRQAAIFERQDRGKPIRVASRDIRRCAQPDFQVPSACKGQTKNFH